MVPYFRSNAGPVLALIASLAVWGCGGSDNGGGNGTTQPPTTGTLNVTVRADGSARSGVSVQRFAPSGTSPAETVITNSSGLATFANLAPGDWDVAIVVPNGFELDDGEEARKTQTVVAGQTATLVFDIVDLFEGELIEARDDLSFSRTSVTVSTGTAVRWVNVGTMLHTVTPDGHTQWTAANLGGNGSTFTHTFNTPGTYEYFCEPHVANGMRGTITVN